MAGAASCMQGSQPEGWWSGHECHHTPWRADGVHILKSVFDIEGTAQGSPVILLHFQWRRRFAR